MCGGSNFWPEGVCAFFPALSHFGRRRIGYFGGTCFAAIDAVAPPVLHWYHFLLLGGRLKHCSILRLGRTWTYWEFIEYFVCATRYGTYARFCFFGPLILGRCLRIRFGGEGKGQSGAGGKELSRNLYCLYTLQYGWQKFNPK